MCPLKNSLLVTLGKNQHTSACHWGMKIEIMKITDNPNLGMKKSRIFFPFFKS